jgi:uncharacterized membrane protein YdcZ (DUF606 family)
MPIILALGGLAVSALFGVGMVLDKFGDVEEKTDKTALNLGGLLLIGIGGLLVYKQLSKG